MNYTKTVWKDLPDTSTPITASNLNNIEDGVEWLFQNNNGAPIGTIMLYGGDTAPSGFKICDGSAISRTTYADLFNIIGTSFGTGDGTTTFNLPNLQGKVPVGLDSNDEDFDTLGETGGEKEHTLNVSEIPSHQHSFGIGANAATQANGDRVQAGYRGPYSIDASWSVTTTGGGQPHNIMQPYLVLNYIIKVA